MANTYDGTVIPFRTTDEEKDILADRLVQLMDEGVGQALVAQIIYTASQDQGVFDLVQLWANSDLDSDKKYCIRDLEDQVKELGLVPPEKS